MPYTQNYLSSETLQVLVSRGFSDNFPRLRGHHSVRRRHHARLGIRTMSRAMRGINGLLLFEIAAGLAGALGILGLVLAVVGVYGVMSYSVSRRTSEIGIRMALGAQPSEVLAMICRPGAILLRLRSANRAGWAFAIGIC